MNMIERGLVKREVIEIFTAKLDIERDLSKRVPLEDRLSNDDWLILAETADILRPFKEPTEWLQSKAENATHGSVWETLPAIQLLLEHLETQKVIYQDYEGPADPPPIINQPLSADLLPARLTRRRHQNPLSPSPQTQSRLQSQASGEELNDASRRHIRTTINNAWEKLDSYYALTDETPVYLAALVLHPGQKWRYFERKWAKYPDWLEDAKTKMRAFYQEHWEYFSVPVAAAVKPRGAQNRDPASFQLWLTPHDYYAEEEPVDEYETYMSSKPVKFDHPIEWWRANQSTYPKLSQMAFDLLSIPAMSAECERVFSQAKLALGPQRNRMLDTTLNALQCLKNWLRSEPLSLVG